MLSMKLTKNSKNFELGDLEHLHYKFHIYFMLHIYVYPFWIANIIIIKFNLIRVSPLKQRSKQF